MKLAITSTAMLLGLAVSASAQELEFGYILSSTGLAGTTLAPSGMSSSASVGLSGFGTGGVVVTNSGLDLTLNPEFDADSGFDDSDGDTYDSDITGDIDVDNDRSVAVSGVLSGIGTLVATGTTSTVFDAQMIAGAETSTEENDFYEDADIGFGFGTQGLSSTTDMDGLARLAGESSSTAGMQMVGQTNGFLGELGTSVGGSFNANASFDITSNEFDDGQLETDGTSGINIVAVTDPINLAVASLGGGTMLLQGANEDLFEGGTLLKLDSTFKDVVTLFDFDDIVLP